MPFKRFDQARPFLALGLVVAVWLVLPVAVKTFTRASFFELQAPVTVSASFARDLQEYWALRLHSNHDLIVAGKDTAHVAATYAFAVQQNNELHSQIERLEGLLRIPAFEKHRFEHARVARRDFSGWWQQLVIRKGKNHGIPLGAPVVFGGGVVGRIAEVRATTSVVELISSPGVRLAAVVEGDTRPFSFQGVSNPSFGRPRGIVEFVPLDISTEDSLQKNKPRRITTSGLGGVFPPGLTLGEITQLKMGDDGLFKTGVVKLDERLSSLTEVTVLIPLGGEP
ncbi:MAG TPA: rod shape-determining protein MreC [Opitutaceae bacterium]|nr:rod shape-determining protein MreC [Opitutaceae bacterium]